MGYRTTKTKDKKKVHKTIESRTEFFYYAFRNISFVGLSLLIVSGFILSLPHSSATDSSISSGTDNIQLNLSTSCTINAVVTSEHTVNLNGGQLDNNVGNTKLSAFCNDNNGYGIYAIGSSGDIDGNTELINTVNESYNIRTGVYDSNNTVNPSSWAMKLTAGTGSGIDPVSGESVPTTPPTIINGYDDYSAIPSNYTLVAKRTSGTSMTPDTSVSGSYLNTTYQIYANSAQPSGTYNGKVKYIIVHPNNNTNNIPDLNAAFAAAGKHPAYQDENGYYYAMQDMSNDICASVTRNGEITATQLVDTRDHNLYWVAKLRDGHCWMTQNLDLDIGGTNVAALTSENTDISTTASGSGIYSSGYTENNGIWTWSPNSTAITSNHTISGDNSVSNWSNNNAVPYSAEGGDTYYYTSNSSNEDIKYTSLSDCATDGRTEAECKHYHAGNYYNWNATVASNNSTAISTQYDTADNSICPKGWRLPTTSNDGQSVFEFGNLLYMQNITQGETSVYYTADGFINIRKSPLWSIRAGYIYNNTLSSSATEGDYWASIIQSNEASYGLEFTQNNVRTTSSSRRLHGFSVRCLAR
ncbi:hypothetical protein IJJ53_00730 [Candidatus Saccharibacteria bacterium]|nr:hypothetical protein [Candidatus Saccharibacteria bacterium]